MREEKFDQIIDAILGLYFEKNGSPRSDTSGRLYDEIKQKVESIIYNEFKWSIGNNGELTNAIEIYKEEFGPQWKRAFLGSKYHLAGHGMVGMNPFSNSSIDKICEEEDKK
jgi:hypothetical protein